MDNSLSILENKGLKIKSVDLVSIINQFRELEGNRSKLEHSDFMKKIRKEVDTLKTLGIEAQGNFSSAKYLDLQLKPRECFELNRDGMLQMLNSESSLVRYKTIQYINQLETNLTNNQILLAGQKIEELENTLEDFKLATERAREQYKPSHKRKLDYNKSIKLLSSNKEEEEDIKNWVFTTLNIDKWEDTCVDDHDKIIDAIKTGAKLLALNKITLV